MLSPLFMLPFFLVHTTFCIAVKPPKLLLISFDGFRWDYWQNATTPNIRKMMANGGWSTKGLKNAFITKTCPNHYTLITGLYEESHGFVGNVFFDPVFNATYRIEIKDDVMDPRWYVNSGEPIWVTNERQNTEHRSGIMMWPGGAPIIKGFMPYKAQLYDDAVTLRQRIDKVIDWFIDEYPINLGLLYFNEPDKTGHHHGPDSPEVKAMVETLDSELGYLFKQLEQHQLMSEMNVILTSDHGMTLTPQDDEHRIDLNQHINIETYDIDTDSPVAALRPKNKALEDEIYRNLSGIPHLRTYKKEDIPDEYHYKNHRRIDALLLVPDEHYWVQYNNSNGSYANHGYNNSLPSMHPIFIAIGPSFKPGSRVEMFHSVDVYSLACTILGLKPAPNNGSLDIVKYLLKENATGDTGTFGIYIFILITTGFVSGVFAVAACRVHRQYKRRRMQLRSGPVLFSAQVEDLKIGDNVPLMPGTSDDEFDLP